MYHSVILHRQNALYLFQSFAQLVILQLQRIAIYVVVAVKYLYVVLLDELLDSLRTDGWVIVNDDCLAVCLVRHLCSCIGNRHYRIARGKGQKDRYHYDRP